MGKGNKMEFTPIESQEQFDAMVKERVERAKKSTAKEYEAQLKDLEGIKEQLATKDEEITALKAKIGDFESEKKTSEESIQGMQKELSELKLKALKTQIAMDNNLPPDMADRIKGDDEEAMRADAEKLASYVNKRVAPSFRNDDAPKDSAEEGYREMARFLERK